MSRRGWLLFLALCVVWGVPYLLIRVAVTDLDPLFVAFARTLVGGLILLPILAFRRGASVWRPTRAELLSAGFVGLMLPGANAVVSVAEHVVMTILTLVRNFVPAHEQIAAGEWRKPGDESVPKPREDERVVFVDHVKRGFSLPLHAFVRGLLYVYGLQVHDLPPNSIMQITCFMVVCECFLGIHPHWALWKRLFYVKSTTRGVAYRTGGFMI